MTLQHRLKLRIFSRPKLAFKIKPNKKITVDLLIDRGTTGTIYPPALAINEEEPDLLATCYTHFYFVKQGTSSILPTMSKENISISIPQKGSNFNNYVEIDYIPSWALLSFTFCHCLTS